jgi:hypothetical protein
MVEWVCLHYSANVLFPVSSLDPGAAAVAHTPKLDAGASASTASNTPPLPKFS